MSGGRALPNIDEDDRSSFHDKVVGERANVRTQVLCRKRMGRLDTCGVCAKPRERLQQCRDDRVLGARAGPQFPYQAVRHRHDLMRGIQRGDALGLVQRRQTFRAERS